MQHGVKGSKGGPCRTPGLSFYQILYPVLASQRLESQTSQTIQTDCYHRRIPQLQPSVPCRLFCSLTFSLVIGPNDFLTVCGIEDVAGYCKPHALLHPGFKPPERLFRTSITMCTAYTVQEVRCYNGEPLLFSSPLVNYPSSSLQTPCGHRSKVQKAR